MAKSLQAIIRIWAFKKDFFISLIKHIGGNAKGKQDGRVENCYQTNPKFVKNNYDTHYKSK